MERIVIGETQPNSDIEGDGGPNLSLYHTVHSINYVAKIAKLSEFCQNFIANRMENLL